MTLTIVLILAYLIGCVCGLRSMTGPALVCWGVHLGWLQLDPTRLAFLHSNITLVIFSLLAIGELIADKLAFIPSRVEPAPLVVRFLFGAACGVALALAGQGSWFTGALLGGIGGVIGAYAGYHLRRWLTLSRGLPDLPVALLEDLVAVGGGLLIVSRF